MAGLVPAIHVFEAPKKKDMDARHKAGHDESLAGAVGMTSSDHAAHDAREQSAAALWPPLRRFIAGEARLGRAMAQRRCTAALYEFLRFGMKQGWACLFG